MQKTEKNILVVGLGFVGLTTALGFAEKGFHVVGIDIDLEKVKMIARGKLPFVEKGMEKALRVNLERGSFNVITDARRSTEKYDVIFFCVGTPCDETGAADLKALKAAIVSVKDILDSTTLLIIKSTVPPGTTINKIEPYIRGLKLKNPIAVNPEFLREGYCWSDFMNPDRIVCGVRTKEEERVLCDLYEEFNAPIHFVTPNTAEFIKYLSNCLLANLVSFSNEMAGIADKVGDIEIGDAFKILHEDNRLVGSGIAHYIYPGCGYGGYCLPKDTVAMIQNSILVGYTPEILQAVVRINEDIPRITAKKIMDKLENREQNIGILGLSFKPNSDDVRYSPAEKIISQLITAGYKNIFVYDPVSNINFDKEYALPITYCETPEELCEKCRVVAIVTIWPEFKDINQRISGVEWIDCRYFL